MEIDSLTIFIVLFSLILTSSPLTKFNTFSAESDLLLYFPMDEETGNKVYDQSNNRNNGTISGASRTEGIYGSALEFDGEDDFVIVFPPFNISEQFTISVWAKYYRNDSLDYSDCIIAQDYETRVFQLSALQSKICWHLWGEYPDVLANDPIQTDRWYHIVVTFNGSFHCLFVDGVLNDQEEAPISFDNTVSINIGRVNWEDFYFNGSIDEVRIYKKAFSEMEIRENPFKPESPMSTLPPNLIYGGGLLVGIVIVLLGGKWYQTRKSR